MELVGGPRDFQDKSGSTADTTPELQSHAAKRQTEGGAVVGEAVP